MVRNVTVDAAAIARKSKRTLQTVFHEVTMDLAFEVVKATPWKTGFLRGSWFTELNNPGTRLASVEEDPSGAYTVARLSAKITEARIGDRIYVMNGAKYAKFLEHGTQHIAPRAFVRGTVNRAGAIAKRTLARIKAKET